MYDHLILKNLYNSFFNRILAEKIFLQSHFVNPLKNLLKEFSSVDFYFNNVFVFLLPRKLQLDFIVKSTKILQWLECN